ncbi:alkane 1-monooxygenase [Pacificimonas flava]|uniref:Luciferase-like monooxygenase n=2 Tax=Pacificimonas TaxID=1960290 RepID=A0A219B3J0_9SPHN|nr:MULTISPECIES: LLM class flavin-dependent oxidoreductase [Pacificimonas]MBZ6377460.1 LLM class flavin-dependent oxidoreductase [Pacificimonas aurantium]OWV32841.1 alkane 1-monooxygenase [Pacificimonas flava]
MIPFSVLDLSPVVEGSDARTALLNSRTLAQKAEALGYNRFWLAEHHGMEGIASAATSVAIAHVAAGTERIRVGAGGVMLPNHAPLLIAEQFGTLDAIHPGRIDLGLGRAPGSDGKVAQAMKRDLYAAAERFPQDVAELLAYFEGRGPVKAVPGEGAEVPVWILGSSLYGAQVAAHFGLPYAFASHFAPQAMHQALEVYRERFQPSRYLDKPYAMLGFNIVAADTDEEAQYLATSLLQAFVNLGRGMPGKLPAPVKDYEKDLPADARARLSAVLSASAIGAPATVAKAVQAFADETGADELIISASVHDFEKRVRSFELAAQVREELARAEAA